MDRQQLLSKRAQHVLPDFLSAEDPYVAILLVTILPLLLLVALYFRSKSPRRFPPKRTSQRDCLPIIIGHRGFGCKQPLYKENTIPAFRRAIEYGLEGAETDVQMTKDGVFILWHDDKIGGKFIAEWTHKELLDIDPDIPTLEQLMETLPSNNTKNPPAFCQILELKDAQFLEEFVVKKLLAWLIEKNYLSRVGLISSFKHDALRLVSKTFKQLKLDNAPPLCALFNKDEVPIPDDYLETCAELGVKEIHCHARFLTKENVSAMHAAGLRIMAWYPGKKMETEPELKFLVELSRLGLTEICTNRPEELDAIKAAFDAKNSVLPDKDRFEVSKPNASTLVARKGKPAAGVASA